jgi:hypothetical protein
MAREETIVLDFEVDEGDSIETIDSLTAANKRLREERKKLDTQSKEGQAEIRKINSLLDKNNEKIKENVSALEKQKINIGNYRSALDGVHPALGKVASGLEGGAKGLKAMTLQALAFLATPLGAALAAIVAVFALLKNALSQNDALMDKFENVTNAVGVVLEVVQARLGKFVEAIIAFLSLDFDKGINLTAQAFGGLADEIGNAVTQQQLFLDASRDLEDSQRNLRIETAKQENVIKQLVVASKNRNLTLDEQEGKLKQALELEKDLVEQREDLARRDLLITARQLRAGKEFQQSANETFDQYIDRLLNSSALGDEELNKIVEKVEALEQARGSSLAFQEKVENNLATIQEKRAVALEKQNKALEEQEALERAVRRAQNIEDVSTDDPLVSAFQDRAKIIEDLDIRLQRDTLARDKETKDQQFENEQKLTALKAQQQQERLQQLDSSATDAAIIFGRESAAYKTLASAQTLISTYSSAQKAFDSLAGIPIVGPALGGIAAALAVAAGLARVAQINGIQFAEGGWTGPGNKYDAVGIVHADEYVTPKRVRNLPEAQPHLMALERMRLRGYADGGLTTSSISTPINQQLEIINVVKNMPAPVVGVKEVTKMQNRVRVKESISKR